MELNTLRWCLPAACTLLLAAPAWAADASDDDRPRPARTWEGLWN